MKSPERDFHEELVLHGVSSLPHGWLYAFRPAAGVPTLLVFEDEGSTQSRSRRSI